MGHCETENSCDSGKNDCHESKGKSDDCCTIAEDILCLAKCAKHELLKEKMKKVLEAKIGKKLDKIADVAVTAMLDCMMHEMEGRQACESYKENLFAAFKG